MTKKSRSNQINQSKQAAKRLIENQNHPSDNPYDGDAEGEYYEKANILTVDEAIEALANYLDNDASEVSQLFSEITNQTQR